VGSTFVLLIPRQKPGPSSLKGENQDPG
jgi:hypothetical protein